MIHDVPYIQEKKYTLEEILNIYLTVSYNERFFLINTLYFLISKCSFINENWIITRCQTIQQNVKK